MFWKVIVRDGYAFGFLFEHETLLHSNGLGCAPLRSKCPKNLVPILEIEALAGVSLFPDLAAGGRPAGSWKSPRWRDAMPGARH